MKIYFKTTVNFRRGISEAKRTFNQFYTIHYLQITSTIPENYSTNRPKH